MPGRREAKELEACLGRAADYDPMYLEGTGGFPGVSPETPAQCGQWPEPLVRDVIRPGLKYPGGFPSDGASETPQPLPARWMAPPDCDLLEPKAGTGVPPP